MDSEPALPTIAAGDHRSYMQYALEQACRSTPSSTNFCVGAVVVYTTMEPCNKRLSGNKTCVERILALKGKVKNVYVGIKEPEKFVGQNEGRKRLEDAGVGVEVVEGLEDQILEVATAGHETMSK